MGVNSLPKTVTRQRRDCDLNPGPSAPESSMLTTQPPFYVLRWLSDNANVSALGGGFLPSRLQFLRASPTPWISHQRSALWA